MMLYTPFSCSPSPSTFKIADTCGFVAGKDSRRSFARHSTRKRPGYPCSSGNKPRRNCVALSNSRDGSSSADGLPVPRESAEKKKLLMKYVSSVTPGLIDQFVEIGPPAVVAAMRNTITNMLGTLPPQFFTVTITTVGENMSQLMLSVLMTGYMFRNAQYRLELSNALGGMTPPPAGRSAGVAAAAAGAGAGHVKGGSSNMQRSQSAPVQGTVLDEETYAPGVQKSRVQGDVLLWHKENGLETLDAVQYIELLEDEVTRLRKQLEQQQQLQRAQPTQPMQQQQQQPVVPQAAPSPLQKDSRQLPVPVSSPYTLQQPGTGSGHGPAGGLLVLDEASSELLDYLRCLDAASLAELTGSAGPEVAAAMESFVARLMGTGDRDSLSRAGSDCTAQELAKVMFWLMVVGYTLRGMEVRWDMERSSDYGAKVQGGRLGGWGSKDSSHETW